MTDPARWQLVSHLLDQALELAPELRRNWLVETCAGDAAVRREVEEILTRAVEGEHFFDRPAAEFAGPILEETGVEPETTVGGQVGPYRIVGEAGHGGMGTVYVAERADDQFRKRVALKLIRGGALAGPEPMRRFLDERQILAALDHANIARLIDGGVTADGLPWFAMEYVQGEPIDRHAAARALPLEARLELFLAVCDAVQYAHRNLVVHRDLKPSNILVSAEGQVKLLDFGIAKLLSGPDAGSARTATGLRPMTPEYASPEQFRGEPVTVATDVYSLGVVLYELLTGVSPYGATTSRPRSVERAVLEGTPAPPSQTASAAERRRLRGDLDTIVLSAMRKEPARRYAGVAELAADLRAYLAGRPVAARPDTWSYRTGKFVARHRLGVLLATAALLALGVGLGTAMWQSRARAREAAKQRAVKELLVDLFRGASPEVARGSEITARELVERGTRRVDTALAGEPDVRSELLDALGVIYGQLGLYRRGDTLLSRAVVLAREAHGARSALYATRLVHRAELLLRDSRFVEAESVLAIALGIRRERHGESDTTVAAVMRGLGDAAAGRSDNDLAVRRFRDALAIDRRAFGDSSPAVAADLSSLGQALMQAGDYAGADSANTAAVALRRRLLDPDHPDLLASLHNLAASHMYGGDLAGAEQIERDVVARRRRLYPDGHPELAAALDQLAEALDRSGQRPEARRLFQEALAMRRRFLAPSSPEITLTLNNLAILEYNEGDLASAERHMREVVEQWQRSQGETHQHTLMAMSSMGSILTDLGRYEEAGPPLRKALALRRRELGDTSQDVAQSLGSLGRLLRLQGKRPEAEELFREALAMNRRLLPAGHVMTALSLRDLGGLLTDAGRPAEAEPLLREALAIRIKAFGPDGTNTAAYRRDLAVGLARLKRYQEAEALLLESRTYLLRERGFHAERATRETLGSLAELYEAWDRPRQARRYRALLVAQEAG